MVTFLLIVLAALVVLALVGVLVQSATSPLMWVAHLCCGSVGFLMNLLGELLTGICDGLKGN